MSIFYDCKRDITKANLDLDYVIALLRCGVDFEEIEWIWRGAYERKKLAMKTLAQK